MVIGRDGRTIRRGCLGDGLQHVQVAEDGTIWTGYFDEGVFGNYGWGEPRGPIGIIATRDRIGLVGTYQDPSLLIVGSLTDGGFTEIRRTNLLAPDGAPLPMVRVHCRGSVVHFFANRDWYSFDLDEFE